MSRRLKKFGLWMILESLTKAKQVMKENSRIRLIEIEALGIAIQE